MKKNLRKMLTHAPEENVGESTLDPAQLEPNSLRERIYAALSNLSLEERAAVRDHLIGSLKDLGVNLSMGLLLLGIPARTVDDLTPYDLAKLIRYLRINAPQAITAISSQLANLLVMAPATETSASPLRRAA
ncbi:MAG: hypothetical protein HY231_07680 [Acidobacteria bacterium]|nr:hypothetical protein [Acidobacteriota bacterium]